jgi:hypothetical protein
MGSGFTSQVLLSRFRSRSGRPTFIHPENFDIWVSVIFLVMAVFGGQRSIPGITASVVILTFATEHFRILGDYRMIGYGVFLAVGVIYFPEGISKLKITPVMEFLGRLFSPKRKNSNP